MDRLKEENVNRDFHGKMAIDCTFCGLPLGRKDRSDDISIARLDNKDSL